MYGDGKLLDTFELGDDAGEIKYGGGMTLSITNLKLNEVSLNEITFEIDPDNLIKELDESNNVAKILFD